MKADNQRDNIRAELERATEALAASTLLYENGYISDAISRLYYFVLGIPGTVYLIPGIP